MSFAEQKNADNVPRFFYALYALPPDRSRFSAERSKTLASATYTPKPPDRHKCHVRAAPFPRRKPRVPPLWGCEWLVFSVTLHQNFKLAKSFPEQLLAA